MNSIDPHTLYLLLPEIVLVVTATALYLAGAFAPLRSGAAWLAAAGLLAAGLALYEQAMRTGVFDISFRTQFSGPLVVDALGHVTRWGVLAAGLLLVMLASGPSAQQNAEYTGSLLLVVAGLMLAAASNELVMLFVSLELISIPTYVLLYLGRRDAAGQEATAKYFFLSILSSALLLYGLSFLYGAAGVTGLDELRSAMERSSNGMALLARLGLILVFAGLGFRLTAVPFHFYAPDVYQGAGHPNSALLATLPKVAAMIGLVRIAVVALPGMESLGWKLAVTLALLTMTLGNLLALWQDNLRRLLAYSSIAHGGYMLIGLAVAFAAGMSEGGETTFDGIGVIFFYLLVYALATLGTFAALAYLGREGQELTGVDDLAGLSRTHLGAALAIAVFMFSLTGIPPLAGFWGKFALLTAAMEVDSVRGSLGGTLRPWFVGLAIAAVLNAAISAAYYLRIVSVMFFRAPLATPKAQGGFGAAAAMAICAVLTVLAGLLPGRLLDGSNRAGESAHPSPFATSNRLGAAQPALGAESEQGG